MPRSPLPTSDVEMVEADLGTSGAVDVLSLVATKSTQATSGGVGGDGEEVNDHERIFPCPI